MAQQAKFITSHSFRVKRANEYRANSGEKISIIDREAIVELYLLEDIKRLYLNRLNKALNNAPNTTRAGKIANESNLRIIRSTLQLLESAIEVCNEKITNGNYSEVWRAIPEGPLMRAAGNTKYMDKMQEMIASLLGQLSEEALKAVKRVLDNEEALNEIEAHAKNTAEYLKLNMDEFDAITNSVEQVAVNKSNVNKPKSNPNLN